MAPSSIADFGFYSLRSRGGALSGRALWHGKGIEPQLYFPVDEQGLFVLGHDEFNGLIAVFVKNSIENVFVCIL